MAKLDLRYRELSVDPLTPSSSKVGSEMDDGPHLEEVQSCTDGMDLTDQCGDLDPSEPPAGSPSPGPDRDPPSAPSAPFVQNAAAFSHDSVLNAAANGQMSPHDGAQLSAGLCNVYGLDVPANCVPLESEGSVYPDHWQKDERL